MTKTTNQLDDSLVGIRSGSVTPGLVETVRVEYYGQSTPIGHLAQVTTAPTGISVSPYDSTILGAINQALKQVNLSAYVFSKTCVMVSVPAMSGEQRQDTVKHLKRLSEEAKTSIRNIRKKFRQSLTKDEIEESDKQLTELTNYFTSEIDSVIDNRIKMVMK